MISDAELNELLDTLRKAMDLADAGGQETQTVAANARAAHYAARTIKQTREHRGRA